VELYLRFPYAFMATTVQRYLLLNFNNDVVCVAVD